MSIIHFNNGIQKPRGVENAELQHLKNLRKAGQTVPAQTLEPITDHSSSFDPYLAAKVEIGSSQPVSKTTYSPPFTPIRVEYTVNKWQGALFAANGSKVTLNGEAAIDNGNDIVLVGNGASLNLNSSVEVDNSDDLVIIGNGVKLSWNSTVGIDNGNDTVIIGNGAKVEFNSITGVDNSDDMLIIGNGAKVKISSITGTDNGSGTLIIGKGADIEITGGVSVDNSKGGITYLDGKVRIHLVDQMKQSFQVEVNVKDKEEAVSFQEILLNKLKNKKLNLGDFLNSFHEVKDQIKAMRVKKYKSVEAPQLKPQENLKLIDKHQFKLAMMQSLVQNLFQYKSHANQGLHKGLNRKIDKIV